MVNTSKILTVSYGTFSCTLEGFDDSFETMKAIAEYFRDLAADDRYFGAEPPTPDADMLARIAEREIERRVEAHQEQGKIVLRAGDAPVALATAAAVADETPAQAPVTEDVAEETPQPETENDVADVGTDAPETIAPIETEEDDAVAVEAAEPAIEEPEEPVVDDASDMPEPLAAEDNIAVPYEATDADIMTDEAPVEAYSSYEASPEPAEFTAPQPEYVEDDADYGSAPEASVDDDAEASEQYEAPETAEEFFQNSPAPDAPALYESEEADAPVADPESVAAKLSAIRSVVSQSEDAYQTDDYSEDEHAQDFLSETAADLDAALALDDANELQANEEDEAEATVDAEFLASLAEKRAREIDEEEAVSDTDLDDLRIEDEDEGVDDTLSQLLADSITADEDENASSTDDAISEQTDDMEDASDEQDFEMPEFEEAASMDASEDDEEPAQSAEDDFEEQAHVNARVIKMTNDEFEAALSDGYEPEDATDKYRGDERLEAVEDDVPSDALLSPEDEEELQRELAEVDADLSSESDDIETEDMEAASSDEVEEMTFEDAQEETPVSAREGRHKFETPDGHSDIERIFDEADNQLEKPESNQRRSAIQHLRAAVAATRAEKKAGKDLQKDVDDTPYRSDLASVVRPRRPSASDGARSERPSESRPAPLKLVAEQRVDTDQAPIRPRRVSAQAETSDHSDAGASEGESNFTEYARQMGATQLPDLLEAAAAYMSDVEGRDQFSRPMLMHKLQEVEKENFSREDGLRSFGKLLREGKIQKIKGGRFTVTEDTDFRDDARHAG